MTQNRVRPVLQESPVYLHADHAEVGIIGRRGEEVARVSLDLADLASVRGVVWTKGRTNGRARFTARSRCDGDNKLLAHAILQPPDGKVVIHLDDDWLNCRRANLAVVSTRVTNQSHDVWDSNSSGYRGVSWSKRAGAWVAYVNIKRRQKYLGLFKSKADAAEAARRARDQAFSSPRMSDVEAPAPGSDDPSKGR